MKRRPSFMVFLTALALSAAPVCAQVTALPTEQALQAQPAEAVASQAPVQLQGGSELPSTLQADAAEFLNPLLEKEWVVLDDEDRIHGVYTVLAPSGEQRGLAGVTINLGRNGVVVQSAVTEPDGSFTFNNLGIGTYALVAKGPNTVAAFALHVLANGASPRLDSEFAIVGTSMAGPTIGEIFRSHLVPGDIVPGYYPDLEFDPYGDSRRFNDGVTVQLTDQGVLLGHISRPNGRRGGDLSGNVVHILRGGQVAGHVATNARGDFQVPGLAPGNYDFIIAGKDGVAAGAFKAVSTPGVALNSKSETRLVSAVVNQAGPPNALNVEMVAPIDWMAGEPEFVLPPEGEGALAPVAGGGFVGPGGFGGGGFGGGGGGGGGMGGLGGLLGIAGLAAGVAAASSNNNGFTIATPQ